MGVSAEIDPENEPENFLSSGNRAGETVTGTSSGPLPNPTAATYPTSGTLTNQLITATQDPAGFSYDYDGNVKSDGNINYLYDANGHTGVNSTRMATAD